MSLLANKSVMCDWCGKLSRHPLGQYTKPDGVSVGYIHAPDWWKDGQADVCEECADGRCPHCGSTEVVRLTPRLPGPIGWGGRCKACERKWSLQTVGAVGDEQP